MFICLYTVECRQFVTSEKTTFSEMNLNFLIETHISVYIVKLTVITESHLSI